MTTPGAPPRKLRWLRTATVDFTPLRRHRDFRLLSIGRLVSFFGNMITVVAFPRYHHAPEPDLGSVKREKR
jgi:hypothetical protein